jgi:hypothetical protein
MRHGDRAHLGPMHKLMVTTAGALQSPAIRLQQFDQLATPHRVYYTHRHTSKPTAVGIGKWPRRSLVLIEVRGLQWDVLGRPAPINSHRNVKFHRRSRTLRVEAQNLGRLGTPCDALGLAGLGWDGLGWPALTVSRKT